MVLENQKKEKEDREARGTVFLYLFVDSSSFGGAVGKWGGGVCGGGEARDGGRSHMRGKTAATIAACFADAREWFACTQIIMSILLSKYLFFC